MKKKYLTNALPEDFKRLAKKAGFCFWNNESWKPVGAQIDWANAYDKELKVYTEKVIKVVFDSIKKEIVLTDYQAEIIDCVKSELLEGFKKEKSGDKSANKADKSN